MATPPSPVFVTTRWSVIADARDQQSSAVNEALATLCQTYWYPLYAYLRRRGYNPHNAEDLTQAFFERLIAKDYLHAVHREKGKFRSFLLTAINHFTADEWDRAQRQKRGGSSSAISIDAAQAEDRYRFEPVDLLDAERLYERRWAMTILNNAMFRLQSELSQAKQGTWTALQSFLVGEKERGTYAEVAATLNMTEDALKMAISRLRQRCRALIREEIAQTVSTPAEIEEEYRALLAALRG
jgi:RNA polymerase sigma factor (sigma-70 family)